MPVSLLRYAAMVFAAVFVMSLFPAAADAQTRTLKLYFLHTKEKATITYMRNGRYDSRGLRKINRFLRDWRRNEPTKIDPRLLDLVWEVYRKSGSRSHIHVISAYRSPKTNSMLRKRGRGVAKKSQHTLGKALDFYLPDVKLSKLRRIGLQMQGGGVGYYPRSGSPFVHLDVGSVRHWPRMSRKQLMAVFPKGRTLHVPTDGKPLPGYQTALANYKKNKRKGSFAVASSSSSRSSSSNTAAVSARADDRGFLSSLFARSADEEEETAVDPSRKRTKKKAPEPSAPVVAEPEKKKDEEPSVEQMIASLPARSIPRPVTAPRPAADTGVPAEISETENTEGAESENTLLALATVPTPSRRPDYSLASKSSDIPQDVIAELVRRAETDTKSRSTYVTALASPSPAPRTNSGNSESAGDFAAELRKSQREDRLTIPLPSAAERTGKDVRLASLQSEVTLPEMVPAPEEKGATAPKSTRLSAALLPSVGSVQKVPAQTAIRARMLQAADLKSDIKIAPKKAKPDVADVEPDSKPVVVPVKGDVADWAFKASKVPEIRSSETLAEAVIRQQPTVVYTLGFGDAPREDRARRFAGNAVTFLSIARFSATN